MIEVLQFVFKRGYAEVDDVVHNVVGCVVGFGIFMGVRWMVGRVKKI